MNRIATWKLWAQKNGTPRVLILVAVHAPEPDPKSPDGDYTTLVEIDGLTKSRFGHCVNSMQSLVLAMQLLRVQVELALSEGWLFHFAESDNEPFDLLNAISVRSPFQGS